MEPGLDFAQDQVKPGQRARDYFISSLPSCIGRFIYIRYYPLKAQNNITNNLRTLGPNESKVVLSFREQGRGVVSAGAECQYRDQGKAGDGKGPASRQGPAEPGHLHPPTIEARMETSSGARMARA